MIKLIMCLRRNPNMTREEFQDYWQNSHGPFFMENANIMGAKKYVQSQTLNSGMNQAFKDSRGMLDEYDGVAEVWFESEEALMQAMGTQEAQELSAALLKDEQNFMDHSQSSAFLVKEVEF